MIMRRTFTTKLALLGLLITFLGAGCGGPPQAEQLAITPITINIWRVFDDEATFNEGMSAYRTLHPNVSFAYRELRSDEYEDELLHAFAEGNGPDIFSVHNTWIGEYLSLIQPMPASVKIPYSEIRGSIKKETIYTVKEEPTISLRTLKNEYVDVVAEDVIRSYRPTVKDNLQDRVFGIPLSVDTLALYYNKDLLNAAGFAEPPANWKEFQDQVTTLAHIGPNNTIFQAGAALGTANNVERATDILNLLMLQNGVSIIDDRGVANFTSKDQRELTMDALLFYTDFANPLKQVYTWNDEQPNSFDAFVNGKTAFFFGYSYHAPLITARSPKLNIGIAPVPQIEGGKTVNYANYWVESVSKQTEVSDWAWDFIQFMAKNDHVSAYLAAAKKPTALRGLITSQLDDETLSVFSSQTLTAKSWYHGKDAQAVETAFSDLIESVLSGENIEQEITNTENKINQTF